jgi:RimJ/RimL family protein N-acetyltransferase
MTDALTTLSDDYEYRRHHPRIDRTVSFRPVEVARDLDRLQHWLTSEHVEPYWELGAPLGTFRENLIERVETDHSTSYVGCLDGVPMSYWERYWPAADPLADHYDARETDQGVHLLIGPEEYLGQGYATALLRGMVARAFRQPETDRVVAEPDASNDAALRVFEKVGFQRRDQFYFPHEDKEAALVVCDRERFEREYAPRAVAPAGDSATGDGDSATGDGGSHSSSEKDDSTDRLTEVEP